MLLMYPAVNHWNFYAAQIASAARSLRLRLSRWHTGCGLQSPSLKIEPTRPSQRSERKQTDATSQQTWIRVLPKCRGKKAQSGDHEKTPDANRPVASFSHTDTCFGMRSKGLLPDHIAWRDQNRDD